MKIRYYSKPLWILTIFSCIIFESISKVPQEEKCANTPKLCTTDDNSDLSICVSNWFQNRYVCTLNCDITNFKSLPLGSLLLSFPFFPTFEAPVSSPLFVFLLEFFSRIFVFLVFSLRLIFSCPSFWLLFLYLPLVAPVSLISHRLGCPFVNSFLICVAFDHHLLHFAFHLLSFFLNSCKCYWSSFSLSLLMMRWFSLAAKCKVFILDSTFVQKQPSRGVLRKRYSEILKIHSKFTGQHPCWSVISIKLNLLHIFRTPFPKKTYGRLLLSVVLVDSPCLFNIIIE